MHLALPVPFHVTKQSRIKPGFPLRRRLFNQTSYGYCIGNGSGHLIQMMILDFSSAKMVLFKPDLPIGTADSLEWYLKRYLALLQSAGHHVRFDLPDFDNDQYKPHINYSLVTRALEREELCADVAVHGVGELSINEYLRETWLDVISKAQGFCGEPPTDLLSSCLTEIKSTWLGHLDNHFHLRFSPPHVKALCKHEVVLYITAAEVHFHHSEDFNLDPINSFENWEFAFIVDVIEEKVGASSSLRLDLSTARFCQHLSSILAQDVHIHFTHIITFLQQHYMELLTIYNMLCIYYPVGYHSGGTEAPDFDDISDDDESEWTTVKDGGSRSSGTIVWTENIKQIPLYGFDHMVAVSEVSINALFASLHKAAGCLAGWNHNKRFEGDFSNIRVKLLSGDKALVTFTIDQGYITLKNKFKHEFTSWTISYEVDIKMVDQSELQCDMTRLGFGRHEGHETRNTVKHIVLDFAHAKYVYKHSSFPGMWDKGPLSAVDKLKSLIHYMEKYLIELSWNGHNIIHSTPIFPHTHQFGWTAASFQVVSKAVVTVTNCLFEHEAPVIMVVGMTRGRPLPTQIISWGCGWVGPSRSHGTVCLSRESFLEGKLLATLELVNRRTTVVPRFPRENEQEWEVYLTTWDHHQYRKNKRCNWQRVEKTTPGWLEYAWNHRDEWSYEHEGTREEASAFSVLCQTRNQLLIPTSYSPRSMEIILRGEALLRLKGKEDKENWNKQSSAKWSVKLHVNSGPSGLRVAIVEEVHPVFDKTVSEGKWVTDTQALLEAHLPRIVDIKEVVQELKQVFEGAWQYSFAASKSYSLVGPTFTQNGDLIVQLGAFTEGSTTETITSSAASPSRPGLLNKFKSMPGYALEVQPFHTGPVSLLAASPATASPLVTPRSGDADRQFLVADGSDQDEEITDFSLKVEQPIFKTSALETDTPEPDITVAGF
ncbi:hypothetical protein DFH08DRAFT_939037 [Mycena albidolilacea]|uniref:Uncharacterized protein n=1 Tax=Mycena albidolilacea TaxID=1033008 RepID=A0AAD7ELN0_9AGAR|nr:hypothetical protein DFH08DRAFT_939037 [Mycena albidolilacea]